MEGKAKVSLQIFFDNFGVLADAPNGIAKLRALILHLAVQGKLVPQEPLDEPASRLLNRLKAEERRLFKSKEIREPKPLPSIEEKEQPFLLPESWEWVRLGEIGLIVSGGTPSTDNPDYFANNGIPWLTPADLYGLKAKFIGRGKKDISERGLEKSSAQLMPEGSVLFSSRAPIGYVAIASNPLATNQGFKSCVPFLGGMSEYIYYFLKSAAEGLNEAASGTTFKEIPGKQFRLVAFPLAPLEEQKRIVAKVDELMLLCDELETQQQIKRESRVRLNNTILARLNNSASLVPEEFAQTSKRLAANFDTLYDSTDTVGKLRSTILQLAVQGKLVRQDSEDGPASDLLEQIQKTKSKSKNGRKLETTEFGINDLPFDVPPRWVWCQLADLGVTQTGTTPATSKVEFYGNDYPFVTPADITNNGINYRKSGLSKLGLKMGRMVPANSVLMVSIGGSIGKVGIVDRDCSCNQQINYITLAAGIEPELIYYYLKSPYFQEQVLSRAPQTTLPIISKGKWDVIPIPLPPSTEQIRIVAKVKQLVALCDELEAKLRQAEVDSEKLMNAAVQHVLDTISNKDESERELASVG